MHIFTPRETTTTTVRVTLPGDRRGADGRGDGPHNDSGWY
jgi:hypothetical protein